ncbi:MAG: Helix-turn-helix domain [Actinomycetota bacterium]
MAIAREGERPRGNDSRAGVVTRSAGGHENREERTMQQETAPAVRRTYTITETAEILGISRTTAYECAKSGVLPVLKLRGRLVVPAAALDAMLAP